MPYITLNSAEPGIRGLLRYRPETGRPLSELAEVLLRGPGTLTRGERELIAAYVSALNDCRYCSASHSACAAAQMPGGMVLVEQVRSGAGSAPVSVKLKTLLAIAAATECPHCGAPAGTSAEGSPAHGVRGDLSAGRRSSRELAWRTGSCDFPRASRGSLAGRRHAGKQRS
jgi:alkylhydroperoxidase family enzyme